MVHNHFLCTLRSQLAGQRRIAGFPRRPIGVFVRGTMPAASRQPLRSSRRPNEVSGRDCVFDLLPRAEIGSSSYEVSRCQCENEADAKFCEESLGLSPGPAVRARRHSQPHLRARHGVASAARLSARRDRARCGSRALRHRYVHQGEARPRRNQAGAAGPGESTCTSPPLAIRGSRWNRATCRGWCGRPCTTTIARTR